MRYILLSLLVVLFALSATFTPAQAQDADEMMKQLQEQGMTEEDLQKMMESMGAMMPKMIESGTYQHPEFGYSVNIPEGWTGSVVGPTLIAFEGTVMQDAIGPKSKAFIIVKQTEEDIAETFRGKKIDEIDVDEFQDEVKKAVREQAQSGEIEIKKIEKTKVNGHDAIHVVQRFRSNDPNVQLEGWMMSEMYVFQQGADHLNIIYMSPEDVWPDYKDQTKEHIKTFNY